MKHKRIKFIPTLLLSVILILLASVYFRYQDIHDWVRLRNYTPPPAIVQLAEDTTLTKPARKVFYVNHPQLQNRAAFNKSCSSRGEMTIVLGCYHPVDRGIFIFDVQDARLTGVDQVTTAHEMLHAAYDRLGSKERQRVNGLLQAYYAGVKDERVKNIVGSYEKSSPDDVINEMHSIFATEIAQLPPDLEAYYSQYFGDRQRVVGYASAYQQEFTSRQNQVKELDIRLGNLKRQIDSNSARLSALEQQIILQRDKLDRQRSSGDIEGYNNGVAGYNASVDAYNTLIVSTKQLIANYNQIVADRNTLALQVAELASSIDSKLKTIKQ